MLKQVLLAGSTPEQTFVDSHAKLNVVFPVLTATGLPQKKGISPVLAAVNQKECLLNHVKGASSVTHLSYVNPVTNAHLAVPNLPVGARFQNFWQVWLDLNARPKVVQILKEGYTLPFQTRPRLTRSPTVVSCYVNPHRNSYLLEALHQLIDKNAIELVQNQTSLGFFNRLFLVPKPNNKWRPILDLSKLNLFLKTETFKMETPETIRTSLQQGEWVTSLDFKDAYFHIPIQEQSQKYLRFHVQGRTYQFKALPFGLSTAQMEFTVIAKEVKLMSSHQGIRIHQYLGRLHMRPIQWHLKNNWRVPESLEKVIPLPRSLHPHLKWWLEENNVLQGQPLHSIKHALQIFTDASKEGWGAHLNEFTARGSWSVPESKLHINYLELKAVFLALKEFQNLCVERIILVATDNTTVVAYINKEGAMRSGPLCALLWRILTWCSQRQVTLKARHIPGHLNVIADKLSRLGQTIQTEWSLLPAVFQKLCIRWHRPQIDLFATRFNHKLPQFVSPVPDSTAVAVDAPTLPWEDLDAYAFPPTSILGKVVEKLLNSPLKRLILIAPGWHALVLGSGSHVQSSPTQPSKPAQSIDAALQSDPSQKSDKFKPSHVAPRATAIKEQGFSEAWQQELRLLKEDQPDQSMRQNGSFL